MPVRAAVDDVERDRVVARLCWRPGGLGRLGGRAVHDAPAGPIALLPDELVAEPFRVPGDEGLERDGLAGPDLGGRLEPLDREASDNRKIVAFLIPVTVLPAIPILGLIGVARGNVVDDVVAKDCNKRLIVHRASYTGILYEPVGAVVEALLDVALSTALSEKVGHTPDEALDAVRTAIDVDAHRLQAAHDAVARAVILRIGPVILQVREFSRIGAVAGMPCTVKSISQGGK